ncbi:hypothetical protein PAXINDRAFT_153974 [Paxillus involutus ATCC 200175]|nr:hypothetical protein PAXINDRAFT_153974 [Paxillus involutus ATCC 200175]
MSDLSPTTTEKDTVTSPLAPSHGHHEAKVSVQPHGIVETSAPPALRREPTHKSTAHAIIERSTSASLEETSPKSHEDKHPSKHPASSHELHRSTQRRGVSDLEWFTTFRVTTGHHESGDLPIMRAHHCSEYLGSINVTVVLSARFNTCFLATSATSTK